MPIVAKECAGLVGRLFGHSYQPRYSVEHHTNPKLFETSYFTEFRTDVKIPQELYAKTYHGDICPRCGDTISDPVHGKTS